MTPMKRAPLNLLIDAVAAGLILGMLATGYVIRYPLPRGTHSYLRLWGMDRHQFGEIHFWISVALLAVLMLHLVLHWQWVVSMVKRHVAGNPSPAEHLLRVGLATVVVLAGGLALFAWMAHENVVTILAGPMPSSHKTPPDGSSPPAVEPKTVSKVSFWKEVYPVLERSCLSCHGPRKQLGNFRADQRQDYFSAVAHKPFVVPGQSAASPLIAIISGARPDMLMADKHVLSKQEVTLFKAWIDAGAEWPEKDMP